MDLENIKFLISQNNYQEVLNLLEELSQNLPEGINQIILNLKGRYNRLEEDRVNGIVGTADENQLRMAFTRLTFMIESKGLSSNRVPQIIGSKLLLNNSFPFLDRVGFRDKLTNLFCSDEARLVLVKGDPKSGMSYLGKFLIHLSKNLKICKVIDCDIPLIVDGPYAFKGELVAKYISNFLGIQLDFDNSENVPLKYARFHSGLTEKLRYEEQIHILFLHDFHKLKEVNEDLMKWMYMIIDSINNFPKSIFIIAGLNYSLLRNWHSSLKFTADIYEMELIQKDDLSQFLEYVFGEFEQKIRQKLKADITLDEYINSMKNLLSVNSSNSLDLEMVGLTLAEHLATFKE